MENKKPGRRELPRNHRYPHEQGDAFGRRKTKRAGGGAVLWFDLIMLFMKAGEET